MQHVHGDDHPSQNPTFRRLCLMADLEKYSSYDGDTQARLQDGIVSVLRYAGEQTAVDWLDWERQESGDGLLALLPPGANETDFVVRFLRGLREALHERNGTSAPRMRVRLSLHAGLTRAAGAGFAGNAVVTAARLCNADVVKQALTDAPEADLVVVVSDCFYQDYIGDAAYDIRREVFTRVRVEQPAKDFFTDAWVIVPGATRRPPGGQASDPRTPDPRNPDPRTAEAPVAAPTTMNMTASRDAFYLGGGGARLIVNNDARTDRG